MNEAFTAVYWGALGVIAASLTAFVLVPMAVVGLATIAIVALESVTRWRRRK